MDAKNMVKTLKELSKIEAFGLVELPKYKSQALVRYMDVNTLKDGYLVAVYAVQSNGLYRDWIPVDSKSFKNTGRCTTFTGKTELSLVKFIMNYKGGKRVEDEGATAINYFILRYNKMVEKGVSGKDFVRMVVEGLLDGRLPENYTIENLNKICKEYVENNSWEFSQFEEISPCFWRPYQGKIYKTK